MSTGREVIPRRKFLKYGAAAAVVAVVGGLGGFFAYNSSQPRSATSGSNSVAVQPPAVVKPSEQPRVVGESATAGTIEAQPQTANQLSDDVLDEFARNMVSGGPPPDGIPPIEAPKYISAQEADKTLTENDIVFGLDYKGVVKAYPQLVLVWHEIVNEKIDGEKVSISYCPLTGSAVGFKGKSKVDGAQMDFGTSGRLLNSNLVMYDRQTRSNWPQVLGVGINGSNKGNVLEEFPLVWTTWGRWKRQYPNTLVLSRDTGHIRSYGTDPYGSYARTNNYYDSGSPFFPVMRTDNRLPDKKVVTSVKYNGFDLAVPKAEFREKRVGNTVLGGLPIAILYDDSLDTIRVFSRKISDKTLSFRSEAGRIVDEETRSEWTPLGKAVSSSLTDTQLIRVSSFDVMWFAWFAFHPKTEVYA